MPTPPTAVSGTSGNDDIQANPAGSVMNGGAGDDVLRGGRGNDILVGGSGEDQMYGGAGADQFRFFASQLDGTDTDKIYDLNFGAGDTLVFGDYTAGLFSDSEGVNSFSGDTAAQVSSITGLRHLIEDSNGAITASQKGNTEVLILTIHNGDDTQIIHISGLWSAYQGDIPTL